MKVRPLHDRLIVKRLEEEEKTKGGIIIPDTAKEKPIEGKVIAAGEGRLNKDGKKMPMEVKTGDRILFAILINPSLAGCDHLSLDRFLLCRIWNDDPSLCFFLFLQPLYDESIM